MTVIVQPNRDSNGNPQPMVYDSDTGKVIVDHDGYVLNGARRLVNVPSRLSYVSTTRTQTSGILEGAYYSASINNNNAYIRLKSGNYTLNATVIIDNSWNSFTIEGDDTGSSQSGDTPDASIGFPAYPRSAFALSTNSMGSLSGIKFKNIHIVAFSDNTPLINLVAGENVTPIIFENCYIQASNAIAIATGNSSGGCEYVTVKNSFIQGGVNLQSIAGEFEIINSTLNINGNTSSTYTIGGYYVSLKNVFSNAPITISTYGMTTSQSTSTGTITPSSPWISINDYFSGTVIQNTNALHMIAIGDQFTAGTANTPIFSSTTVATIFKPIGCTFYNVVYPPNINSTTTTPTVPASGTAQQNTNPYPVNVYVYGGDVTEIQITRNGTAYTVLSVSTAIAMSGQVYKLNPGDSITLTYSTAPSWEWLAE